MQFKTLPAGALPILAALALSACDSGGGGGTQQDVPENQGIGSSVGDGAPGGSTGASDTAVPATQGPNTAATGATTPAATGSL
ncbi:hypothetical protein [Novosphingobium huizhouense]|uniref:hypothetical protein n=1 Tax=Novosphingobium huizhouense TaxID=2866625 RepID=UPI001CD84F1D|nr:hypothetical protein [Novosphingobium huizhouense]